MMNKPWVIWVLSLVCAFLVFGAMGVITRNTLELERNTATAEAKADLESRIRSALWRLDTVANSIREREDRRPVYQFISGDEVQGGNDVQRNERPSPLFYENPSFTNVYWNSVKTEKGLGVASPQVVAEDQRVRWVNTPELERVDTGNRARFKQLQGILSEKAPASTLKLLPDSYLVANGTSNLSLTCFSSHQVQLASRNDLLASDTNKLDANASAWGAEAEQKVKEANEKYAYFDNTKRQQVAEARSVTDALKRKQIFERQSKTYNNVVNPPVPNQVAKQAQGQALNEQSIPETGNPSQTVAKPQSPSVDSFGGNHDLSATQQDPSEYVSPFEPLWIKGELMLVRHVVKGDEDTTQGIWLDKEAIKRRLLDEIRDILAHATLEPIETDYKALALGQLNLDSDTNALVALPWRLVVGESAVAVVQGWTPMRKTLAIAWVGALCAVLAVAVMFKGVMKLSERRASFVSSVTHELRTPLTTFKLYSEMLAEGMVRDEEKRSSYLQTLTKEADRLTHLVENVLAYSRIEKGSARARVEKVSLGLLVDRIEGRLIDRLKEANMEWENHLLVFGKDIMIEADITAVEQILFNLVDNAGKYGGSDDGGVVHLTAELDKKSVRIQIADEGKGIAKCDQRKLFRAFHKSAAEAAHTKPGVGLGLALCRRLARAMGGDLHVVKPANKKLGACFELVLPR